MHIISKILFYFLLLLTLRLYSQGEANNWYFGNGCAVSFNSGSPVQTFPSSISTLEGCASISNPAGGLLFYTDGVSVWDMNHTVMCNGGGLYGDASSTQSAIIVQQPGNINRYYIFAADGLTPVNSSWGYTYSVVDMTLNNGFGCIVASEKNIQFHPQSSEKITAVRHANNFDYWIVIYDRLDGSFKSYLLTSTGLNMTPVSSFPNGAINITGSNIGIAGYMKVSPDQNLIAAGWQPSTPALISFGLYQFNRTAGTMTPVLTTNTSVMFSPYSNEFSPDSKKLYVICSFPSLGGGSRLIQFDLTVLQATPILASVQTIQSQLSTGGLQLAPNGKIYYSRFNTPNPSGPGFIGNLSCIHNPNVSGFGCGFNLIEVPLSPPCTAQIGLPNIFTGYVAQGNISASNLCFFDTTQFQINFPFPLISSNWDFNDPASGTNNTATGLQVGHQFSAPGVYNVRSIFQYQTGIQTFTDTVFLSVNISGAPVLNLPDDTAFCNTANNIQLSVPNVSGQTYLWNTGSSNSSITVSQPNTYSVIVTNNCGQFFDTTQVLVDLPFNFNLPDVQICDGDTAFYQLNNLVNPQSIIWNNQLQSISFNTIQAGVYFVKAKNSCGTVIDTFRVEKQFPLRLNFNNDSTFCSTQSVTLAVLGGTNQVTWNNSVNFPNIIVNQPGINWVSAQNVCGIFQDTVVLSVEFPFVFSFGNDTLLCDGDSVLIQIPNFNAPINFYGFQPQNNFIALKNEGIYGFDFENACGYVSDSIFISINVSPMLDLPDSISLCEGESKLIELPVWNAQYLWNNGVTFNNIIVDTEGIYWCNVKNLCGESSDTTLVSVAKIPQLNVLKDSTFCDFINYNINWTFNDILLKWLDGFPGQSRLITEQGAFFYSLKNRCGDTLAVVKTELMYTPVFQFPDSVCINNPELIVYESNKDESMMLKINDSPVQNIYFEKEGNYLISLENDCGITLQNTYASFDDCDCEVFVPNTFTPNQDLTNEFFKCYSICRLSDFELRIFNRWGNVVFETKNINEIWEGKDEPSGIYVYQVKFSGKGNNKNISKTKKGTVALIR